MIRQDVLLQEAVSIHACDWAWLYNTHKDKTFSIQPTDIKPNIRNNFGNLGIILCTIENYIFVWNCTCITELFVFLKWTIFRYKYKVLLLFSIFCTSAFYSTEFLKWKPFVKFKRRIGISQNFHDTNLCVKYSKVQKKNDSGELASYASHTFA